MSMDATSYRLMRLIRRLLAEGKDAEDARAEAERMLALEALAGNGLGIDPNLTEQVLVSWPRVRLSRTVARRFSCNPSSYVLLTDLRLSAPSDSVRLSLDVAYRRILGSFAPGAEYVLFSAVRPFPITALMPGVSVNLTLQAARSGIVCRPFDVALIGVNLDQT